MINLVLDTFIPGDTALGMPSASELDFDSYQLKYQIKEMVNEFLEMLAKLSMDKYGREFAELSEEQRLAAVNACKATNIRLFVAFLTSCFQAYYSHKTVLNCLSAGSVPPFPAGNVITSDSWSLLESVYERGPIYRTV